MNIKSGGNKGDYRSSGTAAGSSMIFDCSEEKGARLRRKDVKAPCWGIRRGFI